VRVQCEDWERPNEGYYKLNVEASFVAETCTSATGVVIRDDSGFFIACSNYGIPSISAEATSKERGLRDKLLLAGQVGCSKLVINSDCVEDYLHYA
jgi:hypothetical protein